MTPKKTALQAERIVDALTAESSSLRERALTAMLDHILDAPLSTWVAPNELVALLSDAATGPNTVTQIDRHLKPGWQRYLDRCEATDDTLGNALSAETRQRIARLIVETRPPAAEWARDAVDQKLVQQLFAPVLQEFLLGFARRLPLVGGGAGVEEPAQSRSGFGLRSRLKSSVEKRAEKFVEAGKSVLGNMERQIQGVAKDFSESAGRDLRNGIKDRLKSDEGRALANQIVTQALDHVLDTPLAEINKDSANLPWDEIWALLPAVVEHNRERVEILGAVREEVAAWIAVDGEKSTRALLEEAGLLDQTLALAFEQLDDPLRGFFDGEGFRSWLDAALSL